MSFVPLPQYLEQMRRLHQARKAGILLVTDRVDQVQAGVKVTVVVSGMRKRDRPGSKGSGGLK